MLTSLRQRVPAFAAVLALITVLAGAAIVTAPKARADNGCQEVVTRGGDTYCVFQGQQGGGGGEGSGVGIDCDSSGNISWHGTTYKCDLNGWSFSGGCYIRLVEPQPPTNDPIWGSDDPSTSRVQWEDCDHIPPTQVGAKQIVGPCVGYCAGPNPVELITNELQIAKPDLGMAPPGGPGNVGFVNSNVWLWTKGLDTSAQTRRAANVVGTRTFVSADWVVSKAGGGTIATRHCTSDHEYTPDKGAAASPDPDCGFQFKTPGDYTVRVTTSWTLVISQNGVPGAAQTITSTPNTTTITIQEGQSTNG
ncbi:MAG: hypothetical protein AUG49_03415 [Catenulispora sp. 13_1_20CM_3_70_7]|nr:MAG: hypothetical protein AUG49_03415 [Catenulispora sp. 13_1_20CM_3_70_7]